ncbi:MAG: hypothetical protein A3J24_01890 [Deltaproteobacteria bacterium RIFCSPLOWO2_02_FULL_53_8]|nr:MAG: hypothetical protein A3J24_01890 [Deltaproteobacteria bacterium RIFCSPLOWO2_02_FULL_53_8]
MFTLKTTALRVILLLLCTGAFFACSKPKTEADLVAESITKIAEAVEAKDVKGAMKYVSVDFRGDDGSDRNNVKGILVGQLLNEDSISVFIRGVEVEVAGNKAAAHLRAVITRGRPVKSIKDIPRDSADAFKFELILKKEDGLWKVVNAAYERVGLAGFL